MVYNGKCVSFGDIMHVDHRDDKWFGSEGSEYWLQRSPLYCSITVPSVSYHHLYFDIVLLGERYRDFHTDDDHEFRFHWTQQSIY